MNIALLLQWLAAAGALSGLVAGIYAFRWKRRSRIAWMLLGALSFGLATIVLSLLPQVERRQLLPDRKQHWHG